MVFLLASEYVVDCGEHFSRDGEKRLVVPSTFHDPLVELAESRSYNLAS